MAIAIKFPFCSGWGDGTISTMLAARARGPEFRSPAPTEKPGLVVPLVCNLNTEDTETGEPQAGQPTANFSELLVISKSKQ